MTSAEQTGLLLAGFACEVSHRHSGLQKTKLDGSTNTAAHSKATLFGMRLTSKQMHTQQQCFQLFASCQMLHS